MKQNPATDVFYLQEFGPNSQTYAGVTSASDLLKTILANNDGTGNSATQSRLAYYEKHHMRPIRTDLAW